MQQGSHDEETEGIAAEDDQASDAGHSTTDSIGDNCYTIGKCGYFVNGDYGVQGCGDDCQDDCVVGEKIKRKDKER